MKEKRYCPVCGAIHHNKYYCSRKCAGMAKQGYKICVVCEKIFADSKCNDTVCCSKKCSSIHRSRLHNTGIYGDSIIKMRNGFREKVNGIEPEHLWTAKHWVIQSPDGKIFECDNLLHFIRENPELFDGTPKQAFDGFQKIKACMKGKRKNPLKSWKGWTLLGYGENSHRKI